MQIGLCPFFPFIPPPFGSGFHFFFPLPVPQPFAIHPPFPSPRRR